MQNDFVLVSYRNCCRRKCCSHQETFTDAGLDAITIFIQYCVLSKLLH